MEGARVTTKVLRLEKGAPFGQPLAMAARGTIRIGIGGWNFPAWRGSYYPEGLVQKDELNYAGKALSAIEINGTFYRTQKAETFAKWRDTVPDDLVFAVKAHRYAATRKDLREAAEPIERFTTGGVLDLGEKLGPILWQLPEYKRFDADEFDVFLSYMPETSGGLRLRHAIEVRHSSFLVPEVVELARKHGAGLVWAGDSRHPEIADVTADFAYLRLMGTKKDEPLGYSGAVLGVWARQLETLASGGVPEGAPSLAPAAKSDARDVYCFVISGHKVANPAAAQALIERLESG